MNLTDWSWLLILALAAGGLAWLATLAVRRWAVPLGLVDVPNERSSHQHPTPRGGGVSFVVVVLAAMAVLRPGLAWPPGASALFWGSLLVAAVSLADDRWRLPAAVRLGAHLVGALTCVASGAVVRQVWLPGGASWSLGWLGLPLTLVWIVGLTNAYNFMDGIDGLAAGQAVVAAAVMAWMAYARGASGLAVTCATLAGSVLGFLAHNWPPARIFMGDVGSAFLGFTFAGWAVLSSGKASSGLPFWAWVAVLAPFLFDAGVTLVSRILRGQRWYQAHREHFYQRLVRQGWSHLAVTGLYLGVAVLLGLATLGYFEYGCMASLIYMGLVILPLIGTAVLVWWTEAKSARHLARIA